VRLSVAIVNWNTTRLLSALLKSIEANRPGFDYEVIVVDNASSDFDADAFRAEFPRVELIASPVNSGYARGNNQAIERSVGEYVLLLNPDTELTSGALESLVAFMDSHPDAAGAGAKMIRPDGRVDRSVRSFPYPGAIALEFAGLSRLFLRSRVLAGYRMGWFNYDREIEVDQPMGSCLILSKPAIDDIGLFDEGFPIFFNEVDWLYRAKQRGWKVYFTPSATVIHHGGAGTGQVERRKMLRESHHSLIRFYEKHFRKSMCAPCYQAAIACIRLGLFLRR